MRTTVIGGLLTAGLLSVGCGGAAAVEEQSTLDTRKDAALVCTSEYVIDYYAEPEHLTWVGEENCYCGGLLYRRGTRTAYFDKVVYAPTCN